MNVDQNLINDIVQGVLQQLQPTAAPVTLSSPSVFLVKEKLWTADLLEDLVPAQVKVVQQLPGTIVTPSGRDYLRQNHIDVIQSENNNGSNTTAGIQTWKVLVVKSASAFESCWPELERSRSTNWNRQQANDVDSAVTETISILCRGEASGVVILTDRPEEAACFANRNHQVRAVATLSADRMKQLKTSLQPNAVCLDPQNLSYMELRQLWRALS
ncbi:hypothetical protein Pla110_05810 [Polystyrenella longa]|uniref:Uncharacterized protein n=1 Tax=Polystyrenella longa TaxID=2528007 RepID=A0A518CI34_9PLAN|nr:hypothetical protein [Polystyrenella longa]QDU78877.1 hypothetical protein Pla110_05810 [Polystyrenella longa]